MHNELTELYLNLPKNVAFDYLIIGNYPVITPLFENFNRSGPLVRWRCDVSFGDGCYHHHIFNRSAIGSDYDANYIRMMQNTDVQSMKLKIWHM